MDDIDVLFREYDLRRAILTNNRGHFHRLHAAFRDAHAGIVTFTRGHDEDPVDLAGRIHSAVDSAGLLHGRLVRVVRAG